MSNSFKFVGWGVDIGESVGGFRANSRHTKGTDTEKMLKNARLLKTNIFNSNQIDDVGRARKQWANDILNKAFIGDVEAVTEVNMRRNQCGNPNSAKDDKNNHKKEWTRGGVHIKEKRITAIN